MIPVSSNDANNYFISNLGNVSIRNKFSQEGDEWFDNIDLNISDMNVKSVTESDEWELFSDIDVLIELTRIVTQNIGHKYPTIDVLYIQLKLMIGKYENGRPQISIERSFYWTNVRDINT